MCDSKKFVNSFDTCLIKLLHTLIDAMIRGSGKDFLITIICLKVSFPNHMVISILFRDGDSESIMIENASVAIRAREMLAREMLTALDSANHSRLPKFNEAA